jgi:tetratricopeptide (TPR) repeat protein
MSRDESTPADELCAELLAACDAALAAGAPQTPADGRDVSPELRARLEQDVACLHLLHRVLQHREAPGRSGADTTSDVAAGPRAAPVRERPWTQLGRFEIRRELGRGGFGVVYLAYDPSLRREVALKVPRPEAVVRPELRERFVREARAAARLDHPNLVPVYEVGEVGPVCFITSAYCPGPSLAAWLQARREAVPGTTAARLLATLADAVEHAHGRGVLHRDLKPSNVMLEPVSDIDPAAGGAPVKEALGLSPRVTDFGLARLFLEGERDLTQTGVILGTPSYMAPEQAGSKAQQVGPPTDVYALGAILYEMLTGRPPFQGTSPLDTLDLVRAQEPVRPRALQPKVPRDLETLCLKCLQKEPSQRYASAGELSEELRRFLSQKPIRARPVSAFTHAWRWCRRNPAPAALSGALLALLLVVAAGSAVAAYQFRDLAVRERQAAEDARAARAAAVEAQKQAETSAEQLRLDLDRLNRSYRLLETGRQFAIRGQWRQAHAAYTEAVNLRPDNFLVWADRAGLHEALTLWDRSVEDFGRAFALHKTTEASQWCTYAILSRYARGSDAYGRVCREMAERFGSYLDPQTCYYLAYACTLAPNDVDPAHAVRLAENSLRFDPKRPDYLLVMGAAHYRAGRFEPAIQRLREATRDDAGWTDSEAWPLLAMAYHRLGQEGAARHWLGRTRRGLDDVATFVRQQLFSAHVRGPSNRFNWLAVYVLYREAAALIDGSPGSEHALRWLVHCRGHATLGQLDLAEATFAKALQANPEDGQLLLGRGLYHAQFGRWREAAADFAAVFARQAPASPRDWWVHAALRLQTGDADGYRRLCGEMIRRFGATTDPAAAYQVALTCSLSPDAVPDLKEVVRLAERPAAADADKPWHLLSLGAAQYRLGQLAEAARLLRHAAEQPPTDRTSYDSRRVLAWLFLNLACERLGQADEARRWLREAIRLTDETGPRDGTSNWGKPCDGWLMCQIVRREAEAVSRK